jgi:hypothetical protein
MCENFIFFPLTDVYARSGSPAMRDLSGTG